ncbi:MAG: hypothetical protein E6Q83_05215 [Thiothrix sp.]|nr:MAG: hypothetical protein E6Q83_05215 [Thiothrix sp.]
MSCLLPPVCAFCEHLLNSPEQDCLAFHEIPDAIMTGKQDHTEALAGDKGYRFQLATEHLEAFTEINTIRQAMGLLPFRLTDQGHW